MTNSVGVGLDFRRESRIISKGVVLEVWWLAAPGILFYIQANFSGVSKIWRKRAPGILRNPPPPPPTISRGNEFVYDCNTCFMIQVRLNCAYASQFVIYKLHTSQFVSLVQ